MLLKKDWQLANKHMERCSTSLIINETQVRTTMRYHLAHQDGYDFFKKQRNKCWNIAAENRKWFYNKKTILAVAPKVKRKVNVI